MAYNDFSLDALIEQFGLQIDEQEDYFAPTSPVAISDTLQRHLLRYVPIAFAIGTEKARAEFIIAPILIEVVEQAPPPLSIFSGVEFSPDPERGLCGVCDFLLSLSPEQLIVTAPVLAVVEGQNENIKTGINQCIAEMLAVQVFNRSKNKAIETVFGAATIGTAWLFLRLKENTIYFDRTEYHISQPEKIVAILLAMLREAAAGRAAG